MSVHRRSRDQNALEIHIAEQGAGSKMHAKSNLTVAEIGTEIVFNPSILDTYHYSGWKPVHFDLLVVCAAVEFADRGRARRSTQWSRQFRVTLPVLERAAWEPPDVCMSLQETLRHLTGDDWQFSFVSARYSAEDDVRQRTLPFRNNKKFVIAYSNGLDSRCVSGLFDTEDAAVRVRVTKVKDRIKNGERPFDQIPFAVKVASSRETSPRSRAFKFAAITAIAGNLSQVDRIIVPESGQGALGPVLLPLHNTYPDYRNHPTFFRKMERFINALLGYSVVYEQPRVWSTKAQTIAAFVAAAAQARESILSTRSCWQQRWNVRFDGRLRQCGLCAACLLRRMSIHAAGLDEPLDTYTISDLTANRYVDVIPGAARPRLSRTMVEYGIVGARHLQQLAHMAELPRTSLRLYAFEIAHATGLLEQDVSRALNELLRQHAGEWRDFVRAQGQHSFIGDWTKGARHGGSE